MTVPQFTKTHMQNKTLKSLVNSLKNSSNSDAFDETELKQTNISFKSIPSIISRETKIEGQINSSGILEIEGHIKGQINGNSVVIRDDGFVEGEIFADSLNIRGSFSGNIKARNVNAFGKSKIIGNIEYYSLSVEDGASIEGQFKQITDKKS